MKKSACVDCKGIRPKKVSKGGMKSRKMKAPKKSYK